MFHITKRIAASTWLLLSHVTTSVVAGQKVALQCVENPTITCDNRQCSSQLSNCDGYTFSVVRAPGIPPKKARSVFGERTVGCSYRPFLMSDTLNCVVHFSQLTGDVPIWLCGAVFRLKAPDGLRFPAQAGIFF